MRNDRLIIVSQSIGWLVREKWTKKEITSHEIWLTKRGEERREWKWLTRGSSWVKERRKDLAVAATRYSSIDCGGRGIEFELSFDCEDIKRMEEEDWEGEEEAEEDVTLEAKCCS